MGYGNSVYIKHSEPESKDAAQTMVYDHSNLTADELVHEFLKATPIACALWDMRGVLIDCNEEILRIYGFSEKLKGFRTRRFFEMAPEYQSDGSPSGEKLKGAFRAAVNIGYKRFEWMAHTVSGEPLPLDATMVRVPWKDSYRIAVYVQDLRPVKAHETEMKNAEERIRIMLDSISLACTFFDDDGRLIDCNQRAVDLYECTSKQEYIDNFYKFSPKYQRDGLLSTEKLKQAIREAFETGEKTFIWDHVTALGKLLPAKVSLRRVKWKDGFCVVSYAHNLSEVRDLQDDLIRAMSIIEGSPNFVFYINMDHVIKYMNPAVFTISGYTKEEFFTYGLGLILNGEDLHRLHEEYLPAVIKQRHLSFEMNITCKNGEKRIFQFSAFAANLYSGEVGVGLTVSDITKLVRMQQDLIKAKENAERAMLEAQYYNRAKSNFLSRMSHEMRTPMNAIINLADLTRTSNARRRDHYLEEIGEAARLLMGIINNILDMMEIENGTFALVPKLFSLPDMLQRVTEKTRRYAEKKKQQFAVDFGGELPGMVVADEERLEQALYNLLNNAVKFTPEQGAIAFSVRTLKEDDIRYELYFEVRDTGIGVSPGQQDRLWQVFEQGDNSISRQYGGTGLGLSIVKGIVTLMDGSIRLESEPGKGSQFIFTVRLDKFFEQAAVSEAAGKSRSRDFPDGSAGVPGNFAGKRVLLADDMEVNRDIILALLEGTGILVDCAADGSNALEIFTANSGAYDLLLMDLHMPLMDGFEAARHIRRSGIPNADTVPIIAVTADTGSDVVAQCLEAGMNGHISKPVALEALFETLGRYLPGQ